MGCLIALATTPPPTCSRFSDRMRVGGFSTRGRRCATKWRFLAGRGSCVVREHGTPARVSRASYVACRRMSRAVAPTCHACRVPRRKSLRHNMLRKAPRQSLPQYARFRASCELRDGVATTSCQCQYVYLCSAMYIYTCRDRVYTLSRRCSCRYSVVTLYRHCRLPRNAGAIDGALFSTLRACLKQQRVTASLFAKIKETH